MSEEFNKKIGAALRIKRQEKRLSQEYVAGILGISKNQVSNWEIGKRSMYAESLEKYCEILGCPVQEIFDMMKK